MNKKKTNSETAEYQKRKLIVPLVLGILFLASIVQSFFILHLMKQGDVNGANRLVQQIALSVDGLSQEIPRDSKTGIVYIAEAGLTLPVVPSEVGYLQYSYQGGNKDFKPVLHVSRKNDVNRSKSLLLSDNETFDKMFSHVPKLQACSRGVSVSYDTKDLSEPAGSKILSNGITVYFSVEPLCKNEALLSYVKQINSYN